MAKIHHNPKNEGRMPLILLQELADKWLIDYKDELDKKFNEELIQEYPDDELQAYPVHQLRGKNGIGNVEAASERFEYEELPKY